MYELIVMQDAKRVRTYHYPMRSRYIRAWALAHYRASRSSECLGFWIRGSGILYRVRHHRTTRRTRLFPSAVGAWRTAWS